MTMDRGLLYHFVRDALRTYSEAVRVEERGNPTRVQFNGGRYSLQISYIHDSGNSRVNDDEVRIQISRTLIEQQREREQLGERVAFVGFFEGGRSFVAWDPEHVFSLQAQTVVSVYARQSLEARVLHEGAAAHEFQARFLGKQSFAIALPSSALGFYLENIGAFHGLSSEGKIQGLLRQEAGILDEGVLGLSGEVEYGDDEERQRFTFTRTAFPRDPKFKRDVLKAYDRTCCVCGRQLALIQAAHIIPHAEEGSPNIVQNGLALCIEHHRLYDDALLLPGPERRLVFNEERAEYLRQTKQERGLDEIAELNGANYEHPTEPENVPADEYLQRGLEIRLGT